MNGTVFFLELRLRLVGGLFVGRIVAGSPQIGIIVLTLANAAVAVFWR